MSIVEKAELNTQYFMHFSYTLCCTLARGTFFGGWVRKMNACTSSFWVVFYIHENSRHRSVISGKSSIELCVFKISFWRTHADSQKRCLIVKPYVIESWGSANCPSHIFDSFTVSWNILHHPPLVTILHVKPISRCTILRIERANTGQQGQRPVQHFHPRCLRPGLKWLRMYGQVLFPLAFQHAVSLLSLNYWW